MKKCKPIFYTFYNVYIIFKEILLQKKMKKYDYNYSKKKWQKKKKNI